MMTRSCAEYDSRSTLERYVAGTTSTAETQEFESHLIGCRDCQEGVRLGGAIRAALRAVPAPTSRPSTVATISVIALAAGVVMVAGVALLSERRVQTLGEMSPPAYGGVAVRAAPSDSLFDRAMRFYLEGRYGDAADAFVAARAMGADSTSSSFFAGASRLLRGDDAGGAEELRIVIGRGDSPYRAEAHYYIAKSWLRRARPDSALAHLAIAGASPSPIAPAARALADSIAGAIR